MSPYVIEVSHGLDIVTSVTTFCNQYDTGLCVLSGSGKVSYVSFKLPCCACYDASAPVVHEGCYELLSISAIVLPPSSAMLTSLSNNDVKEDEDNARYSGNGSVSEAKGVLLESGGGDYGRN
uniref:AT-hook motif nuclear-localized protein 28-like n=1 Tax=Tanacetum cinerariifolium TaxID=118510 RepID=A0A699KII7_TANCI|nr:AT-hook motif nuclear-localized protein 28-like [Tanacetum cinerariifolium]